MVFFPVEDTITYIGLEHPLNACDLNVSVMKEMRMAETILFNYNTFQNLLYHVMARRKATLIVSKVHGMVGRMLCEGHGCFPCKN